MPGQPQKRTHSVTSVFLAVSPPSTPTKKSRVAALPTLVKGKAGTFISRAIAGSSRLIPSNARPFQVNYLPFD